MNFFLFQADGSNHWFVLMQNVSQTFFVSNFGINFVLYCMSGQNFRFVYYTNKILCLNVRSVNQLAFSFNLSTIICFVFVFFFFTTSYVIAAIEMVLFDCRNELIGLFKRKPPQRLEVTGIIYVTNYQFHK